MKKFSHEKVVWLLWSFLFLRNLVPHFTPRNFSHGKVVLLRWRFFLSQILLGTLDVVVLEEESCLVLSFSRTFLVDLKMSSKLLESSAFAWFFIFCVANILQRVLEHFTHSSSLLILPQICAPLWNFESLVSILVNFLLSI